MSQGFDKSLKTHVNLCFPVRTNPDNRVQKCFENRFHAPPLSISIHPLPLLTMFLFDRTNLWKTEIVIFNIDMGEGERTVCLSLKNIENYAFSKKICT